MLRWAGRNSLLHRSPGFKRNCEIYKMNITTQPDIILSREQGDAVAKLVNWFKQGKRSDQIFAVAGFAGVGKSTVLKYAIRALGLTHEDCAFLCFTGKASQVLRTKGLPAMTIHRFIYEPRISSTRDPYTGLLKTTMVGSTKKIAVGAKKLIVVDEVSMVSAQLLHDLKSFNIKILVLGDPGQLAPVMGKSTGLLDNPDVFLKEIHRQAADSPIIWASMLAREGRSIPYGTHGDGRLCVVPRSQVTTEDVLRVDQVLTCMHVNRKKYNADARAYLGYDTPLPCPGEKLVGRSNRWDDLSGQSMTPLTNGLQVRLRDSLTNLSRNLRTFTGTYYLDGAPDDLYYALSTNLDFFEPIPDAPRGWTPDTGADVAHLDFATAMTVHTSQGSEWSSGIYLHDAFGSVQNRRELLYTGITRFSENLTIAI